MTWYFDPTGDTIDVYDHTGTLVADDRPYSGQWSGEFPTVVFDVMREQAEADGGFSPYTFGLFMDAIFEDIEQGTPPV